jgi:hypothetical protein
LKEKLTRTLASLSDLIQDPLFVKDLAGLAKLKHEQICLGVILRDREPDGGTKG